MNPDEKLYNFTKYSGGMSIEMSRVKLDDFVHLVTTRANVRLIIPKLAKGDVLEFTDGIDGGKMVVDVLT